MSESSLGHLSKRSVWLGASLLVVAGILSYHNSFEGPFIFDDRGSITNNESVQRLWPLWVPLSPPKQETVSGRPILNLSLALNYAIGKDDVWGYHAANLAIHILASLTLFGVMRRTLGLPVLRHRFGQASSTLALISALIWLVHPLQTESVTYIVQRAESLMGLFFLLTLYCMIRGAAENGSAWWYAASITSCALGMGTKEVMVAAPLVVVTYDRVFIARSWKELIRRRWALYTGLACSWGVLAGLVASGPRTDSAGIGLEAITPLEYARTQCVVVLHYLRLAILPHPLVLDYCDWPIARWSSSLFAAGAALLALLACTAVGLVRRPALGFLGVWFFLILAPTSSFVPILEIAAEHRMYLPLAAVIVAAVIGTYLLGRRLVAATRPGTRRSAARMRMAGAGLIGIVILVLIFATIRRNDAYRSEFSIWSDAAAKRPENWRVHNNLGIAYSDRGEEDLAFAEFNAAIQLNPRYWTAYTNRGAAYLRKGEQELAFRDFGTALKLAPDDVDALYNRGFARLKTGDYEGAIRDCERALTQEPRDAGVLTVLGFARLRNGEPDAAIRHLDKAIQIDRRNSRAYAVRGMAYVRMQEYDQARRDLDRAIELDPGMTMARKSRQLLEELVRRLDRREEGEEKAPRYGVP